MMFCPECGAILRPKEKNGKKVLFCSCGFNKNLEGENSTELTEKNTSIKSVEIIENVETLPKIKITCEKCNNKVAYFWTSQTRGADEPETRFFRCSKCNYTWREYS
ncbi:MAG: transcription factor S [Candidatus Woesearchaeota archaeon]